MYDKPVVQLSGEDGNVFAIIGRARRAFKNAQRQCDPLSPEYDAYRTAMETFTLRATNAKSYDEVLQLCFEFFEVE